MADLREQADMTQPNDGTALGADSRRRVWIACETCGKQALVRTDGAMRFCSRACSGRGHSLERHPAWKGTGASYASKHERVRNARGSADHCERCGRTDPGGKYEWASLTHNYDDIWDYEQMCKVCHEAYDRQIGSGHYCAKLTEELVAQIRERHAAGESVSSLAREFGVAVCTMDRVVDRRTWKSVPGGGGVEHRPRAKLTAQDVRAIRAAAAAGESHTAIGRRYQIDHSHISAIVRRTAWRSVT